MEDMKKNNFVPNNKINSSMMDWKIWSDKYFPVEEKIKNWNAETIWVLNPNWGLNES